MINVIGTNIEYTIGDTFNIAITSDVGFATGTTLRLQIIQNVGDVAVIDKIFSLNSDGEFGMILSEAEKNLLPVGDYVYRLSVIDIDGNIETQQSGNFKVKWGA